jgi:hypothetical protein
MEQQRRTARALQPLHTLAAAGGGSTNGGWQDRGDGNGHGQAAVSPPVRERGQHSAGSQGGVSGPSQDHSGARMLRLRTCVPGGVSQPPMSCRGVHLICTPVARCAQIIYLAPLRALVQERVQDWQPRWLLPAPAAACLTAARPCCSLPQLQPAPAWLQLAPAAACSPGPRQHAGPLCPCAGRSPMRPRALQVWRPGRERGGGDGGP